MVDDFIFTAHGVISFPIEYLPSINDDTDVDGTNEQLVSRLTVLIFGLEYEWPEFLLLLRLCYFNGSLKMYLYISNEFLVC
jgi:hypothetical protein